MKKITLALFLFSFCFSSLTFAGAKEEEAIKLNSIASVMEKVLATEKSEIALKELKKCIDILDEYKTEVLKSHEKNISLGNIYLYYASMTKGNVSIDETIRLLSRSLKIKNDPYTHKELASVYKIKYDDAVINNNAKEEQTYGAIIYEHLNKYIILSHNKSKTWKERRDYFNSYSKKKVAESSTKKYKTKN